MYEDSITQILQDCVKDLEGAQEKFLQDPANLEDFVADVKGGVLKGALAYISMTLSSCDEWLCKSLVRRGKGWYINRHDQKTLTTSIGDITFTKTLFRHKGTGELRYLLDDILGLGPNERLTRDAKAAILEESVETSYRKGGEAASILSSVSKECVKELIHSLEFPSEQDQVPAEQKKVVDCLFIDADEDHVALQFNQEKGDLQTGENGYKINTETAKLVYVYEGVRPEAPESGRHRLVNPYYFGGVYKGSEANGTLWDEVFQYIDHNYDLTKVKKIYLGADGGGWIKACPIRVAGITYALDQFHLEKYLMKITRYLADSAEDAREELRECISQDQKREFREKTKVILSDAETDSQRKNIQDGIDYILQNWEAAMVRISGIGTIPGCSAEGHVSHVLSARMSSRPMGWSSVGVDKMAHLRAYYYNHGSMLALVRQQPKIGLQKAAGAEGETFYSCNDILVWERHHRKGDGKYIDAIRGSISDEISKKVWFSNHIWLL